MWQHLEDAIREGTHRWKQAFGTEGPIFSSFFRTEEAMEEFLMGMNGFGMITSPQIVNEFDLSRFRHLVDLGGATGHLAIAACKRYSHLQATVFDLPHALGLAKKMIAESGISDRLNTQGGDFFTDPLPQADLYALGRIVHDWSVDKIQTCWRRFIKHCPQGSFIDRRKNHSQRPIRSPWALMQSLNMLVCTEGQERTLLSTRYFCKKQDSKRSKPAEPKSPRCYLGNKIMSNVPASTLATNPDCDSNRSIKVQATELIRFIQELGPCAIAFSGGVDSSVVANAAWLAIGKQATAVTESDRLSRKKIFEKRRLSQVLSGSTTSFWKRRKLKINDISRMMASDVTSAKTNLYARVSEWPASQIRKWFCRHQP